MFILKVPVQFTSNNLVYNDYIHFYCMNELAGRSNGSWVFNYQADHVEASFGTVINDIISVLGFYPFGLIQLGTCLQSGQQLDPYVNILKNGFGNKIKGYGICTPGDMYTTYWHDKKIKNIDFPLQANMQLTFPSGTSGSTQSNYFGIDMCAGNYIYGNMSLHSWTMDINACSENIFIDGAWNSNNIYAKAIRAQCLYTFDGVGNIVFTKLTITISDGLLYTNLINWLNTNSVPADEVPAWPSDDPYGITVSGEGGADGNPYLNPDSIIKQEVPPLPTLSAVDAGLITMYNPSNAQIKSLAGYLWGSVFDLDTLKKLFSDPMDAIIGLGIIPVTPQTGGSKTVKFGNIDTGITMPYLSSQFVEKDCGSVKIEKSVGSFLDYSPYVNISIYLPYIGFRDISPDDVMGDTLTVKYHVDCLTGGCTAMIYSNNKGVIYQFNGSCIANVPLTAINYSTAIQNAVSAVGSIATMAVGAATGAAPLTAMGATGLISSGANSAVNSKPTIQRSGSMGGAAGLMALQKPYVIISRPRMCVPSNMNHYYGNMVYVTKNVNQLRGFTLIDSIRLDGIPATQNERDELLSILRQGVIF